RLSVRTFSEFRIALPRASVGRRGTVRIAQNDVAFSKSRIQFDRLLRGDSPGLDLLELLVRCRERDLRVVERRGQFDGATGGAQRLAQVVGARAAVDAAR